MISRRSALLGAGAAVAFDAEAATPSLPPAVIDIARAQIPTSIIGVRRAVVAGYDAIGDAGSGAVYRAGRATGPCSRRRRPRVARANARSAATMARGLVFCSRPGA